MGNYPQYSHHPYISFPGLRVPWYPGHRHRRRRCVRAPRPLDPVRPFFLLFFIYFYFYFFLGTPSPPLPGSGSSGSVSPPAARSPRLPRSLSCQNTFHLSCCACALSARVRLPPAGVNAGLICSRAPFFAAWGASAACLNQPNLGHY